MIEGSPTLASTLHKSPYIKMLFFKMFLFYLPQWPWCCCSCWSRVSRWPRQSSSDASFPPEHNKKNQLVLKCTVLQIRLWIGIRLSILMWIRIRGLQRDIVYFGWPIAPTYMSPNVGEGGLQGISQWVQLYTGAQINIGDLTPYLTYDPDPLDPTQVKEEVKSSECIILGVHIFLQNFSLI